MDFNIWFGNDPQFSVNPSILKSSPFNNNIHSVTNSKGNFYVEGVFTDASLNNTPNAELPASLLRVSATPKNNYDNADILTMNLAVAEVTLHKFVGSGTLRLEIKNPDGSSVAKDVIVNVDPGLIHLSGYTFWFTKTSAPLNIYQDNYPYTPKYHNICNLKEANLGLNGNVAASNPANPDGLPLNALTVQGGTITENEWSTGYGVKFIPTIKPVGEK